MALEILYLAWNRLEFTRYSFRCLLDHTDWDQVERLVVYDDGSEDGTAEHLQEALAEAPCATSFRPKQLRSPVAIMLDYLALTKAKTFVKIDNDIPVPPGWLPPLQRVMNRNPDLDLLGMAAGWTGRKGLSRYDVQPSSHIGGVGMMRVSAFRKHPDLGPAGRFGFTEWQHAHPEVQRGWITPDVEAVQLDLIPEEPWLSLTLDYRARGWAREWPPYQDPRLWAWMKAKVAA